MRALEMVRQAHVHVEGRDGVLDSARLFLDLHRVADRLDPDLIDREAAREQYRVHHLAGLMRQLDGELDNCDAVIVSDYAKGLVTQQLLDRILGHRRDKRPFIAVDTKPSQSLALCGVNLITPNRSEAAQIAGLNGWTESNEQVLAEICRRIHERFSPEILVVTLGQDGMAVSQNGRVDTVLPTEAREVFDVSGAGDTVIATLTAALVAGVDPLQAAQFANAAAGCVVGRRPGSCDDDSGHLRGLRHHAPRVARPARRTCREDFRRKKGNNSEDA